MLVLGVGSLMLRDRGLGSSRTEVGPIVMILLGFAALCFGLILWLV
jgi:hypothetical protein